MEESDLQPFFVYPIDSSIVRKKTLPHLFVIALVLLAGCNAFGVADDSSQPDTSTLTPASVPTDQPTPTPVPQLAPGITGSGIENGTALTTAHRSILQNQSFVARVNRTILAPNGSVIRQMKGTAFVGSSKERFRLTTDQLRGILFEGRNATPVGYETWWTGNEYYLKTRYENGTIAYQLLPSGENLTGYDLVYSQLGDLSYLQNTTKNVKVEQTAQNDSVLYSVQRVNRSEDQANVALQLLVTPHGVIREYSTISQRDFPEGNSKVINRVQLVRIGGSVPERPAWVDKAINRTTTTPAPESPTLANTAESTTASTTTLTEPVSTPSEPTTTIGTSKQPSEHPGPPAVVLRIANQTGEGTRLNVDTFTASENYTAVVSANGKVLNRTEFSADETFSDTLTLNPPLTQTTTVTVTLNVSTTADPVTDQITYTVAEGSSKTPTDAPTDEPSSTATENALIQQYNSG